MKTNQSLEIKNSKIVIKADNEYSEVSFTDIRLVSIIHREGLEMSHIFYTGGSNSFINLDLIDEEQAKNSYNLLINIWDEVSKNSKKELSEKKKLKAMESIAIYIKDYQGNTLYTSLRVLKETENMGFLTNLYNSRLQRRKKTQQWLSSNPIIELHNGKLQFSKQGCQIKKKSIPWEKVNTVQIEQVNFSTLFYVLPEGVSGGMFSFKKSFYAININVKEAYKYSSEYFFWKALADENFLEK